jgi:hypothetical protein
MNRNALPYLKNTHTATVPRSVIGVGFVPKPGTMRALPRVRPSGDIYRRMYVLDAPGNEWITECDVLTHDYHSYGLESTKIAMQASKDKAANATVARSLLPNLREIFLPSHGVGHK